MLKYLGFKYKNDKVLTKPPEIIKEEAENNEPSD